MSIKSILEFEYFTPKTTEEALELLAKYAPDAKLLSGGTDLVPKMKAQALTPKYLINTKDIDELNYIEFDEEKGLSFGTAVTIREVENHPAVQKYFPALYEGAHAIASTQIRNMGTLVGNICNAVPSADSAPGMLVLDAIVHIASKSGKRDVPIKDFFTGVCKTVVAPDEMVTGVTIPMPSPGSKSTYLPFTVRKALDLAMVGSAVSMSTEDGKCTDIRIALGAVAVTPKRAYNAEQILLGNTITDELIELAANEAAEHDCAPITDIRATAEYRRHLVYVLTRDAIKACM